MKEIILPVLIGMGKKILGSIILNTGQSLWRATWSEIFLAVEFAERKWEQSGRGENKKRWVIKQVMAFVKQRAKLNWLQRRIIILLISQVANAIVDSLNEEIGHNWIKHVESLERELAGKIPFID